MKNQKTIRSSTQEYLDIFDIVNDFVIMKDGSCSLILNVDAVNFGLLAEPEQDAIIYTYAALLNSLNYPIQIMIRSQTKDVSNYLKSLEEKEQLAKNETDRRQISEYRAFVSQLIRERNVLDKKFYVIIPAPALELGLVSAESVIPGVKKGSAVDFDKTVILDKASTILYPRRDHLVAQFARIGLYARQLNTQEVVQLFYNSYNPESSEGYTLADTNSYTAAVVESNISNSKGATMINANPQAGQTPSSPAAPAANAATPQGNMNTTAAQPAATDTTTPTAPASNPMPAANPMPTPTTPTAPAAPTTPAPTPTPATATPGVDPLADAQSSINDSVQALGNDSGQAAPTAPAAPAPTTPAAAAPTPPAAE